MTGSGTEGTGLEQIERERIHKRGSEKYRLNHALSMMDSAIGGTMSRENEKRLKEAIKEIDDIVWGEYGHE